MRLPSSAVAVVCAAAAMAETPFGPPSFSAEFGAYAPGEALGGKGTQGGGWTLSEGASATNVVDGAAHAMALRGTAHFTAAAETSGNVERIDFSLKVEALDAGRTAAVEAMGGLLRARIDGAAGY